MDLQEEKVTVVRIDEEGNQVKNSKREMTKTQFGLIGSDPKNNGGWKLVAPSEAGGEGEDEDSALADARAKYEELYPGESAGRKSLENLNKAIAKAENPDQ